MSEAAVRGKAVVIVDVLRSCTTIAFALTNGAEKIIPAATVESATRLMSSLDKGSTLLCGEREGRKVAGFDLGNSPLEYTREIVGNKTLVFASTNGTRLMLKGQNAQEQLLCSFVNVGRVVERLRISSAEMIIACSGAEGQFSLEDTVCAGMVASRLVDALPGVWELNDGARAAISLFETFGADVHRMLRGSAHGRNLLSLGFGLDLEVCARVDSVPVLPVLKEGRITVSDIPRPRS